MSLYHLKSSWYHQHEVSPQDLNTENICQFSSREHRTKLYFITYLVFCSLSRASLVAQTVKNLPANAGDRDSILELGRSPREGNGNPLQYSCLGNPTDRGAWQATVHGVTRVGHDLVTKPPSPFIYTHIYPFQILFHYRFITRHWIWFPMLYRRSLFSLYRVVCLC